MPGRLLPSNAYISKPLVAARAEGVMELGLIGKATSEATRQFARCFPPGLQPGGSFNFCLRSLQQKYHQPHASPRAAFTSITSQTTPSFLPLVLLSPLIPQPTLPPARPFELPPRCPSNRLHPPRPNSSSNRLDRSPNNRRPYIHQKY